MSYTHVRHAACFVKQSGIDSCINYRDQFVTPYNQYAVLGYIIISMPKALLDSDQSKSSLHCTLC